MKGLAVLLMIVAGCSSQQKATGPYAVQEESLRDTEKAKNLTIAAANRIDADPSTAEELLREALAADLFHGPAHNNLGVVFLAQGKLYEAAGEFEWARKLMPGHPDPRVNLALTLERAEKTDDALAAYSAALEVHPGYLPAIMGAASLAARTGREDERLAGWIEEIALRAEDEAWAKWARERLALGSR